MTSATTTVGNVVVVTHVLPVHEHGVDQAGIGNKKFNRVQPVALGTVQIMIGVIIFLFGIVAACNGDALGVYSGIFVWGAGIYIASGSLTVVAGKSVNRCLINGALGLNVVAAVFSVVGVVLYSMDTVIWRYYHSEGVMFRGSAGVLALLHLLELIVAATVAGFACHATCYCCSEPSVSVRTVDGSVAQTIPTYQPAAAATSSQFIPQPEIHFKSPGDPTAAGLVPPAYAPN